MRVLLPFFPFVMEVLKVLNVAPPNCSITVRILLGILIWFVKVWRFILLLEFFLILFYQICKRRLGVFRWSLGKGPFNASLQPLQKLGRQARLHEVARRFSRSVGG